MTAEEELENLTQGYLDGSLSGKEMNRLNALLIDDEGARRAFAELLNLDSAIAATVESWKLEREADLPVEPPRSSKARKLAWLSIAACLLLSAGGLWFGLGQENRPSFATVAAGVGVNELPAGMVIRDKEYHIEAGTVELLTARGVRVVIEAPAEFRFESVQRLHMTKGRLAADVPPEGKGFTVITPSGDAVDLGTRFGVDVSDLGAAEVHVFEGEVIAKAHGDGEKKSLRAGDALAMRKGSSVPRDLRSSAFIQRAELGDLSAGGNDRQRLESQSALARLRSDPAAIAILDFEGGDSYPGSYRVVQGRWPGSRAPEFIHGGDHLKLNLGGQGTWSELTLAAWVRLDRLGAPYQSLLHANDWEDVSLGLVHWMVNESTTMRFAVSGNRLSPDAREDDFYPDSRTPVSGDEGRWVHLAAVYDSRAGTVRFYHNGRFDKEARQSKAYPARLGPAQIGNWNKEERKLSGRVDELVVLGRAMDDEEVRDLFHAGNPYQ